MHVLAVLLFLFLISVALGVIGMTLLAHGGRMGQALMGRPRNDNEVIVLVDFRQVTRRSEPLAARGRTAFSQQRYQSPSLPLAA